MKQELELGQVVVFFLNGGTTAVGTIERFDGALHVIVDVDGREYKRARAFVEPVPTKGVGDGMPQ